MSLKDILILIFSLLFGCVFMQEMTKALLETLHPPDEDKKE